MLFNQAKLRAAKAAKNLTNFDLAEKSGISPEYIGKVLQKDHANPTVNTLDRICEALGLTLRDVVEDTDSESN